MSDLPRERPLPQLPPAMPWWVLPGLTVIVLVIFAGVTLGVFLVRETNMMIAMAQAIVQITTLALGYWLGSSNGSQKKDEAMARISLDAAAKGTATRS